MAFVDDYTAWVVGDSEDDNAGNIQTNIIPKVEQWAATSGASFDPKKTAFIHFSRKTTTRHPQCRITMQGISTPPSPVVKILGVLMDEKLNYKLHMARAASKGVKAALALSRLRGLRPVTARNLFTATVTPVTDYASPLWSTRITAASLRLLDRVQRTGAQAITRAFRTVSLDVAEMEASILPTRERLQRQALRFWINHHTLEKHHPFWRETQRININNKRLVSPLQKFAQTFAHASVNDLENIKCYCLPPWSTGLEVCIQSRERAVDFAAKSLDSAYCLPYCTKASARNDRVAVAVASKVFAMSKCVGSTNHLNAYIGNLIAIKYAVDLVSNCRTSLAPTKLAIRIFSDSQSALKALLNPFRQSGQELIRDIHNIVTPIQQEGLKVSFHWLPAHAAIQRNQVANAEAKALTRPDAPEPPPSIFKAKTAISSHSLRKLPNNRLHRPDVGRFTKAIDLALPGPHTRDLYDPLSCKDAAILSQLRTSHCRLNKFLHRIGALDSNMCACGRQPETVRHFLLNCSQWTSFRREMTRATTFQANNLSHLLGGWSGEGDLKKWKPDLTAVKAVIQFVKSTERFVNKDFTT
jgi:hypothetical protein